MRLRIAIFAAWLGGGLGAPAVLHAHGPFHCTEPRESWQPQMTLQQELKRLGWRVRRIMVSSGCYEVYGFDAQKKRVEAYFNPRTFERMEVAAQ